jgi:ATP-dependent helicase HrpA
MREWRDIHSQLHALAPNTAGKKTSSRDLRGRSTARCSPACSATSAASRRTKGTSSGYYLGARGMKFLIHPGSALNKKAGKWIAAG